jgi:hypothetical protein
MGGSTHVVSGFVGGTAKKETMRNRDAELYSRLMASEVRNLLNL